MSNTSFNPPQPFDWNLAKLTHRGHLPHVRQDNALYFITFRLNDSLPADRRSQLIQQRDQWLKQNPPPHTPAQQTEYRKLITTKIENLLDSGHGICLLGDPRCRNLLDEVIHNGDGLKYQLGSYVIMPNHVHAILQLANDCPLHEIIKAWKSFSTRKINKHTSRQGELWMEEYFDHAIRDIHHLQRFIKYIQENPARLQPNEYTLGAGTLK